MICGLKLDCFRMRFKWSDQIKMVELIAGNCYSEQLLERLKNSLRLTLVRGRDQSISLDSIRNIIITFSFKR